MDTFSTTAGGMLGGSWLIWEAGRLAGLGDCLGWPGLMSGGFPSWAEGWQHVGGWGWPSLVGGIWVKRFRQHH